MFVKDAMTPNPITVTINTSLPDIAALMRDNIIRRLPVMDGDRLVGIISDHDVMATMPSPATTLNRWEMNTLLDKLEARDFMTHPVHVTTPDCPLEEVARYLVEKKIGALPAMEGDRLVGIITETDIFRVFVDMLSGGEVPGLRFELRAERHRGVVSDMARIVNDNGGRVIAMATLNESDGVHKLVLVKEEGGDEQAIRAALHEADIEVLDVRQRRQCQIYDVG